jgi:hypothetical protein
MHSSLQNPSEPTRSIRELGGEIWAELDVRIGSGASSELLDWKSVGQVTEIVMAVLARYSGHRLVNDTDLPVEPLEKLTEPP